jgi:hypothetical protein
MKIVGYSRPIPFAVRPAIREQIKQMLQDNILEIRNSPFLNPLSVVYKEDKKIRIRVDARRVNQHTVPDRERTAPLQELLQKFEGAQFMSTKLLRIYKFRCTETPGSTPHSCLIPRCTNTRARRTGSGILYPLSSEP